MTAGRQWVVTGNSWSVHLKHTSSLIATMTLTRTLKIFTESEITWTISILVLHRAWMIKKTITTSGVWPRYLSPAELPKNLILRCSWFYLLITIVELVLDNYQHCPSHRHFIESLRNVFDLWENGILNRSQFWTHIAESFKRTSARTIRPNKTLLCSSSRGSGYRMIAMVCVRRYLKC